MDSEEDIVFDSERLTTSDDESLGFVDPPTAQISVDILNALPPGEMTRVVDAARGEFVETFGSESEELAHLLRTAKDSGYGAFQLKPEAPVVEERQAFDWGSIGSEDLFRVTDAVLNRTRLPDSDPLAGLVAEQILRSEQREDELNG